MHYLAQNLNNYAYDFYHFEVIDSTMNEAKRLIDRNDLSKKVALLADSQTDAYGKIGRHWLSPLGNICLTIIYPLHKDQNLASFSLVAGLALLELIDLNKNQDFEIKIKWPNDIYINNQKIAGILPEIYKQNLILGVGINWAIAPENFCKIDHLLLMDKFKFIFDLIINLENKLNNYLAYGFSFYQIKINNFLYQKESENIIEIDNQGHLLFKNEEGKIEKRLF